MSLIATTNQTYKTTTVARHTYSVLPRLRRHITITASEDSVPPLSFVAKNEYVSADAANAVIEPHRATFFTATGIKPLDDESNRANLGADALRLKMRHLETLIERGGSETMQTELTELKRKHKLMVSKEENITGVLYTWKINDETYHGRTVGPITFGLGVAEAETMVQITLTEAR